MKKRRWTGCSTKILLFMVTLFYGKFCLLILNLHNANANILFISIHVPQSLGFLSEVTVTAVLVKTSLTS